MADSSPRSCRDHDFVWEAIYNGEVNVLKALTPEEFNWRALHPVKKITPLQTLLASYIVCETRREQDFLGMAKWMIEQGADPLQKASIDSDESRSFFNRNRKKDTETDFFEYKNSSAVKLAIRMKSVFTESHRANKNDWAADIKRLEQLLEVFCRTPTKLVNVSAHVDEAVVDLWERVGGDLDSCDVRMVCKEDMVAHCHSCVVSVASPVLKAMLMCGMREDKDRTITIPDTEHSAVKLFLEVLYCGSSTNEEISTETVIGCLDLAHRWQVVFVLHFMERMLCSTLTIKNFDLICEAAFLKCLPSLLQKCKEFAKLNKSIQSRFTRADMPAQVMSVLHGTLGDTTESKEPTKKKRRMY